MIKAKYICNQCGKKFSVTPMGADKCSGYAKLNIEWGYFSNKDGEIHEIILCEQCYDNWIKGFKVGVSITEKKELLN